MGAVSAVLGVLIVAGLLWFAYGRRLRIVAKRQYSWRRSDAPDIRTFAAGFERPAPDNESIDEPPPGPA